MVLNHLEKWKNLGARGASLLFRDVQQEYPAYFASPFMLYLDLLDGRGRNRELAQQVLEKLEL